MPTCQIGKRAARARTCSYDIAPCLASRILHSFSRWANDIVGANEWSLQWSCCLSLLWANRVIFGWVFCPWNAACTTVIKQLLGTAAPTERCHSSASKILRRVVTHVGKIICKCFNKREVHWSEIKGFARHKWSQYGFLYLHKLHKKQIYTNTDKTVCLH